MRPTLYIHLRDAEANAELAYRLDAAATGSVHRAPLETIAQSAAGARVVVIVPGQAVHFLEVELPVRSRSRALTAAPFACEDRLAEDVDRLHFAHLGRAGENRHRFAVLSHQNVRAWVERLEAAGIVADALIPDILCLPPPEEGEWCVLADADGGGLLVRQGERSGLLTSAENFSMIVALSGDAAPQRIRQLQIEDSRDIAPEEGIELLRQPEFGTALDVMVRNLPDADTANLLQGPYAPQSSAARHLRPWRAAAIAAALVVALVLSVRIADTLRLQALAEAQKQENLAAFNQQFPGYSDPQHQQLARYLGAEAREAEGTGNAPMMLPLLESYAAAAGAVEGLRLLGMQWRDQALTLNLQGESLANLESLREWYRGNTEVAMEVQNADAGSEGVRIRVRLSAKVAS